MTADVTGSTLSGLTGLHQALTVTGHWGEGGVG